MKNAALMPPKVPDRKRVYWSQGYTLDPIGVCIWPFSSYRARWADLKRIEYIPWQYNGKWSFRFRLSFAGSRQRRLMLARKGGLKSLHSVAEMLRWIDESGASVEGWRESGVQEILSAAATLEKIGTSSSDRSDVDLLRRAEVAFVALQIKEAIGDCAAIIGRRSEQEVAAARLKTRAELFAGHVEDALDTLAELILRHPEEIEARASVAFYLVNADDKRGLQLASAVLDRALAKCPSLAISVAGYHLRHKEWDQAAQMLDRLKASGAVLNQSDREIEERIKMDLERLRNAPKQAFWDVTFGRFLFKLRAWLPMSIVGALCLWPLFLVGPIFARECWHLLELRQRGSKADIVQIYQARESIGTEPHFLESVDYKFAPDRSRVDPISLREPGQLSNDEFRAWSEMVRAQLRGELPHGWYRGESLVFKGTAGDIRALPAEQFVTYLPEDPSVNAIGPITDARIWLTWIGAPKALFPGLILVGTFGWTFTREFLQRRRRHSRGFDPANPVV